MVFIKHAKFLLVGVLIFMVYSSLIKNPLYSSTVSFYTNYSESNTLSSVSFISSFTNTQSDDLGFSISDFIVSDKILQHVVEQEYNINNNKTSLVEYWGQNYKKIISVNPISTIIRLNRASKLSKNLSVEQKKLILAKEVLKKSIIYTEDRKSSLHTIKIVCDNAKLSRDISSQVFQSIVSYSNEVTNIKAKEKKDFIKGRLLEINRDLEKSENDIRLFLEKNKKISSSPSLVIQKDRLERDITLYSQLYVSLSDQLEIAKIDEKDNTSSIFLLDAPNISPYKTSKGLIENILTILSMLFIICALFEVLKNRNQLFI